VDYVGNHLSRSLRFLLSSRLGSSQSILSYDHTSKQLLDLIISIKKGSYQFDTILYRYSLSSPCVFMLGGKFIEKLEGTAFNKINSFLL